MLGPLLRACALAATLAAVAPATTFAATTVTRTGTTFTVTGDGGPSRITGGDYTDAQFADELGGAVTAGGSCTQVSASLVDCGVFPPGATITVNLGDGDDYYKRATVDATQLVDGGPGNDTIETGNGQDTVSGGPGNDDLTGGRGDDVLDGGEGNDTVDGWDGSDTLTGGPGTDRLLGDGATLYAGGSDVIFARDGEADSIDCGGGADRAQVDGVDVVAGCASVDAPAAGGGPAGPSGPGPAAPVGTPAAPTLSATLGRKRTPADLASGKKVSVALTASATCGAQVALAVTKGEAKRLGLGKKALTLGTSTAVQLVAGTKADLTVAVARKHRAKLRRATRVKAAVIAVCVDAAGRSAVSTTPLTFKR